MIVTATVFASVCFGYLVIIVADRYELKWKQKDKMKQYRKFFNLK